MNKASFVTTLFLSAFVVFNTSCKQEAKDVIQLKKNDHIILIGGNLGSRMMEYGFFETELQMRYPDSLLYIRNMCDGGNTPAFRPHSGRPSPWAFPGAEKFKPELYVDPNDEGFFENPDQWITRHKADIIIAMFGYTESFRGEKGLASYKEELDAFIKHTLSQKYNGKTAPQLVMVSPIAFEDLSKKMDLPDGKAENANLELYTAAIKEAALKNNVPFIDMYLPTKEMYAANDKDLTIDGSQLNSDGYALFSESLIDKIFGKVKPYTPANRDLVHEAVMEKNWMWFKDIKMPNGVQVFGRRFNPFGPDNFPAEIEKLRELTAIRDEAIWKANKGEKMDLAAADAQTKKLPEVKTNYTPSKDGNTPRYLSGEEAIGKIKMAPGFKIELFASEKEFPELEKPVQLTFDNKGRLWVAVMPTYPQWKPGDPKPNDKILIFEDTDGDGKADKQTVFADHLTLPVGFELSAEGVYLSQGTNLVLLTDTNGDDKADKKEILLSGFDDHDTHHAHHAYTSDGSGSIYMGQGVFLHSDIETSYGTVRATNGGFFRFDPVKRKLEYTAQLSIPNPWGIMFDEWGQNFYAETSGPNVAWMMPGSVKPRYGAFTPKSRSLIEEKHRVRPTSGLELVSSRHFPPELNGDFLINNTIGFLGTKEHTLQDDGTGYKSRHRQDLLRSDDPNFRPVDLEFAPDGSLYVIDWHNVLIGHMQHNQRDPLRDHTHGRIYRITYPSRPLVKPAAIAGAPIDTLLNNLKLPEYRTRYRTRRELRGRNNSEVSAKLKTWVSSLDKTDSGYEHHLLEALWVSWGMDQVDQSLLHQLLQAKDYKVRAAAVRVLRYSPIPDQVSLLKQAADDNHGRVRLEAIVAASWLDSTDGLSILKVAGKKPFDDWMLDAFSTARAYLEGVEIKPKEEAIAKTDLKGTALELYNKGSVIYAKEGYCMTCHQPDGNGLSSSGFPSLVGTKWIQGNDERLIKLVLKGLRGPLEIDGKKYTGQVPMTPFAGLLSDEEVASVLTYVRNSFGNKAPVISPAQVKKVRDAITGKKDFYTAQELLEQHPD